MLRYLPTHLSAPEIAAELSVSVSTVKTHMRNVFAKLGTHRRAAAVEHARELACSSHPHPGTAPRAHRPTAEPRQESSESCVARSSCLRPGCWQDWGGEESWRRGL